MTVKDIRTQLDQRKGRKNEIEELVTSLTEHIKEQKRSLRRHEQAREIIKEVGLKTQQELQYHISDITSLALEAVFPDPYELVAEFVERRNKSECDLYFTRDGNKVDPIDASGGGAVDIASFALRVASWSMQTPRSRPTIILDEPFRFLSEQYKEPASMMVKELSQKLGLQFIIITHEPVLASYADKTFEVTMKRKISKVN